MGVVSRRRQRRNPESRAGTAGRPSLAWVLAGDRSGVFRRSLLATCAGAMVWATALTLVEPRLTPPAPLVETLLLDIESANRLRPGDLLGKSPRKVPEAIRRVVMRAADTVGIETGYLLAVAARESSFRPGAYAQQTTAAGLYQFTEDTWLRVVKVFGARHGLGDFAAGIDVDEDDGTVAMPRGPLRDRLMRLRYDPEIATVMAAELARDNRQRLARVLGREVTPAETYIAHFLGVRPAARMIAAAATEPQAPAARLLPAAAVSNPAVFRRDGGTRSAAAIVREIEIYFRDEVPRFSSQSSVLSRQFSELMTDN